MCYIIFMTIDSVFYVVHDVQGGSLGPPFGGYKGDKSPAQGFRGNTCDNSFLLQEVCCFLPHFSCPLLGGFSAHGFCRWFFIFG
jgi:hypothetical protein